MLNKVKFQEEEQRLPERHQQQCLAEAAAGFGISQQGSHGRVVSKPRPVMVMVAGRAGHLHTLAGSHQAWLDGKGWQQGWQSRQEVFRGDLLLAALGRR